MKPVKEIPIDKVFSKIEDLINLVNEDETFSIMAVGVSLKVTTSVSAGISIPAICVAITGGASKSTEIDIEFIPVPKKGRIITTHDVADSVQYIKAVIEKARTAIPDYTLKAAAMKFNFTISESGEINFIVKAKESIECTHSLMITLGKR